MPAIMSRYGTSWSIVQSMVTAPFLGRPGRSRAMMLAGISVRSTTSAIAIDRQRLDTPPSRRRPPTSYGPTVSNFEDELIRHQREEDAA